MNEGRILAQLTAPLYPPSSASTCLLALQCSLHRALRPPASWHFASIAEVAEGTCCAPLAALLVHKDARPARPIAMTFGGASGCRVGSASSDHRWGTIQESPVGCGGYLRGREHRRWCNRLHPWGRWHAAQVESRRRVQALAVGGSPEAGDCCCCLSRAWCLVL